MFVTLRSGLAARLPLSGISKELCKIRPESNVCKYQIATLKRAVDRDEDEIPNIKPFPYHIKSYNLWNMLLDTHKSRLHEHSKLIVIDGQIASGKNKLAQELAKELDFLYIPQPTFDDLYITPYGFDIRSIDYKLPKNIQSWDIERFLQSPHDINNASMQMYMYLMRQIKYMNALAHIFSTGQGVVTIRSPWTDGVFAKAMCQSNYISKGALEAHTDSCLASLHFYLRPHLIIYLDVPVDVTQKNIKKRGLSYEVNSPVLNEKYLSDIENNYKNDYLRKLSSHTPLLIYDWSDGGDTEVVLEDIENVDFTICESGRDPRLEDWRIIGYDFKMMIKYYTHDANQLLCNMDIMRTDVPELLITAEEDKIWDEAWLEIEEIKYAAGFNPLIGDNVLWKMNHPIYPDNVTPLMKKYYERKERLKQRSITSK